MCLADPRLDFDLSGQALLDCHYRTVALTPQRLVLRVQSLAAHAQCVVDPVGHPRAGLIVTRSDARAGIVEIDVRPVRVNPGLQLTAVVFDLDALTGAAPSREIVGRGVLADHESLLAQSDCRVRTGQLGRIGRIAVIHEHAADLDAVGQLVLAVRAGYPELLAALVHLVG